MVVVSEGQMGWSIIFMMTIYSRFNSNPGYRVVIHLDKVWYFTALP